MSLSEDVEIDLQVQNSGERLESYLYKGIS